MKSLAMQHGFDPEVFTQLPPDVQQQILWGNDDSAVKSNDRKATTIGTASANEDLAGLAGLTVDALAEKGRQVTEEIKSFLEKKVQTPLLPEAPRSNCQRTL